MQSQMFFPPDVEHFDVAMAMHEADCLGAQVIIVALNNPEWGALRFLYEDYQIEAVAAITAICEGVLAGKIPSSEEWLAVDIQVSGAARKTASKQHETWLSISPEKYAMQAVYSACRRRDWNAKAVLHLVLQAGKDAGLYPELQHQQIEHIYDFLPEVV